MAEYVVSSMGQTIGKLLIDEAKLLWDVEGKVKDLKKELELIQGFLRDADARQEREQAVGEWIAQLRDIVYDAEDVLEQYILRVAQKKEENIIKAYARFVAKRTSVRAHVVGTEIDGLKSSISNLRTSMQTYGIQMVNEGEHKHTGASMLKRTYAHFEEDFVGRENSIKELVKELLKDGEQHRVICICGMNGLGKTSLAKKVLIHDEVKKNFNDFAWACISQEYNERDVLKQILGQLGGWVGTIEDRELFKNLSEIQQEKRCITVLDDIRTKQSWDRLRAAFSFGNTRSKLLITTRNREVAEYINAQGLSHEPRCLSYQESWDLLKKRAFLEKEVVSEDMKRLGDELLKKCGGLPLAVKVLSGLLAFNEWEEIYKKINLQFSDKSDVSKLLALSYDNLPCHLKPCFLYLGSFRTNEIPARKFIHMLIAEGFVLPSAHDEEVAEQYLVEFANRGMVQVQFTLGGKIKTCRLHDLMRDLCVSKVRQEGFLQIQQDDETEDSSSSSSFAMAIGVKSSCKTRRLSLNVRASDLSGMTMHQLRTLRFDYRTSANDMKQFEPIFVHCKFLRVLKIEDFHISTANLPESVGDLVHLRYLSLARSTFTSLPQSMGNLVRMEFLDLCVADNPWLTVPNVLWKMRRLKHLHLPRHFVIGEPKKLRLDTLKNLRTLRNFSLENCDVSDVGKLTNLKKLTVNPCDELEIIPQLAKFTLKYLRSSSFLFVGESFTEGELSKMSGYRHSCKLFIDGVIEKLPEHKNLPQQLRKLVLFRSQLEEDPMPILEKLEHLVVLMLRSNAFVGKEMVCSAGGFPQLKHLLLHNLPNLEEWRVAEGAMPRLSQLGITECPELKAVPKGDFYRSGGSVDEQTFQQDEHWQHTVMMRSFLINATQELREYFEDFPTDEEKKMKGKGRALDFVLGRTLCGRTRRERNETSE